MPSMHAFTVPAQHVVVNYDRCTYNYYLIAVASKVEVSGGSTIIVDRNGNGRMQLVLPVLTVNTYDRLREAMAGCESSHIEATWELVRTLV